MTTNQKKSHCRNFTFSSFWLKQRVWMWFMRLQFAAVGEILYEMCYIWSNNSAPFVCLQVTTPLVWNRKCRLWAAMGQRAALLLSELLLLLLLTASRTLLAVSFPEDIIPLDIVDAHCEYAHTNEVSRDGGRYYEYSKIPQKRSTTIHNVHVFLTQAAMLLGLTHIE